MSLELRRISHRYRDACSILHEVSVAIPDDVTAAIVGPSGSGKSTLLSIIGLLLSPTQGEVWLDGRPVPLDHATRAIWRSQTVGWIFQTANILGRRTVFDNVALSLLAHGWARDRIHDPVDWALGSVGLSGFGERVAGSLSGGEIQRMCVARAMVGRPRLVLADEPTGQLDQANTARVVDYLIRARPSGTNVVVATHDLEVASRCDVVWRIANGRLWQEA